MVSAAGGSTAIVGTSIKGSRNSCRCNRACSLQMKNTMLLLMISASIICDVRGTMDGMGVMRASKISPFDLLKSDAPPQAVPPTPLSPPPLLAALSVTQKRQRQLQQQQLFQMLTRNRQGSSTTTPNTLDGAVDGVGGPSIDVPGTEEGSREASSFEITGFVADDGQQYERATKLLKSFASNVEVGNNNSQNSHNCPAECKCLSEYFDCGKKHLDHVPELPAFVQALDLVGNKLNDTSVLGIRNLPELHRLNLKRNLLQSMPIFVGLASLKQLNLAHNHIEQISSEALVALPKLKSLDLSRNYLHSLQSSHFPSTNRLAHLLLNFNEITSIDENTFEHLGELLDLELNNNSLSSLPPGVFRYLGKLKKLSLNSNYLEINWSTFKGLLSLQKLYLKSNNIRALTDGVFHVMRAIETIELDNNGITSLSRQGLFNLTKLHQLSLSNNSISRIEPDTWEFTQSLVLLDLSHNNISEFKPQHLDCLQRLRYLNLGHNKIEYLVESTFECVKNLEDLNLRRNKLSWIIEDQGAAPPFKSLKKLKKLDLYGNNLKQITSKSLSGLTSLESLNLGGNALASVQSGAFDQMQHLQKLTFKSLNFICDCELLWFRRWLQRNSLANPKIQKNAVCGYPDHLLDRELLSLTSTDLICAESPKPVILQEPSNQLAVKGANITMQCLGNSPTAASLAATDELKIKWRHDNHNIKGGENTYSYTTTETQIHHDPTTNLTTIAGFLRLYNVSYENAGRYQCVISNAFGTTYSQKFKISIGIHPVFLQIPSNLTIDSGETARLVCSATGDPLPEIALQKFDASDFPAAIERRLQVIREENAFVITNAKPTDTGIYTCTAESAAGEIKVNASLIVNDKPQPQVPVVRQEVVVGRSSVLECISDMTAELIQPSREWYKDNKPFHTSSTSASERHYFTADKELLVIVRAQSMDAGPYRCEITDNTKTIVMKMELVVVKEDTLNDIIYIILIVLLVIASILVTFFCWRLMRFFRRKHYAHGSGAGSISGSLHGRARVAAGDHVISGSRSSTLDQTHLTTLNRTYLQQQQQQQQQQHHQQQQQQTVGPLHRHRPCSLAELEMGLDGALAEPHSCLIVTATPNYEQLLQRSMQQQQQREGDDDDADVDAEEITLDFLHRTALQHNGGIVVGGNGSSGGGGVQDHLSSKDSGTGSDAAVKPTIEDDDDVDFAPSLAIGVSEYDIEMYPLRRAADHHHGPGTHAFSPHTHSHSHPHSHSHAHSNSGSPLRAPSPASSIHKHNHNHNNSSSSHSSSFDGGGSEPAPPIGPPPPPPTAKCKGSISTNYSATGTPQAVDI